VGTIYLFHLRVVLVLIMVRSRPHHLRHQGPQINIFASSNHIHLYTYFKNPYIHVQVFPILRHHIMKLLQAFKSFLTGESIVESRQQKLVCCRPQNLSAKTASLHALQFRQRMLLRYSQHTFSSKHWFATDNLVLAVNHKFAADNTTSAANGNSLQTINFQQWMLILHMQHNFGNE
jgi:hypothetical protein